MLPEVDPLPLSVRVSFFFLGDATNGEVAYQVERAWTGLNDYRGFERNGGEVLHVKEVLTLQFVVSQTAAGVHTVCLDLDVQNSAPHICGRKLHACVPFVEGPFNGDR